MFGLNFWEQMRQALPAVQGAQRDRCAAAVALHHGAGNRMAQHAGGETQKPEAPQAQRSGAGHRATLVLTHRAEQFEGP